jgi:glycerol-3-phosphate acyltransferase PlsY
MIGVVKVLAAWLAAYLLGSIPPGMFWAWIIKRVDVRKQGSGRTGGSNVWRAAGFSAALLTAIFDGLKGAAAIWVGRALGLGPWALAIAGTLAVIGHNYSLYLGLHGGAGTMTSIGVAAALWLPALPILIGSGLVIALLVGHTSMASILVALLLPILFAFRQEIPYAVGMGLPTMILTLWALRPNIKRLYHGEERFIPVYYNKPPLIRISRHPHEQKDSQ